jgi:hypothetical protein
VSTVAEPQPVVWLVLQRHGVFGVYDDEDTARDVARTTGNLLTHVPVDADHRQT